MVADEARELVQEVGVGPKLVWRLRVFERDDEHTQELTPVLARYRPCEVAKHPLCWVRSEHTISPSHPLPQRLRLKLPTNMRKDKRLSEYIQGRCRLLVCWENVRLRLGCEKERGRCALAAYPGYQSRIKHLE